MTPNYTQIAGVVYQAATTYDQFLPPLQEPVARSWAKVFAHHQLSLEDLLAGVDKVYLEHGSGYRPLPADIADAARALRQNRAMREPEHTSSQRELANAAKLAREILSLAETKTIPNDDDLKIRRPTVNPLRVVCTYCHAPVARPCVRTATKQPMRLGPRYHPARIEAAEKHSHARVSVVVADRQCHCGREILDNADACDRCQPIVNGPEQPNGNTETA
jgi:hypothetical protein